MISEPHIVGTEFGELQYAMWKTQFQALRDGDSNFYLWNRPLHDITRQFDRRGLSHQQTLADIIVNNTDLNRNDIHDNMFLSEE